MRSASGKHIDGSANHARKRSARSNPLRISDSQLQRTFALMCTPSKHPAALQSSGCNYCYLFTHACKSPLKLKKCQFGQYTIYITKLEKTAIPWQGSSTAELVGVD